MYVSMCIYIYIYVCVHDIQIPCTRYVAINHLYLYLIYRIVDAYDLIVKYYFFAAELDLSVAEFTSGEGNVFTLTVSATLGEGVGLGRQILSERC